MAAANAIRIWWSRENNMAYEEDVETGMAFECSGVNSELPGDAVCICEFNVDPTTVLDPRGTGCRNCTPYLRNACSPHLK